MSGLLNFAPESNASYSFQHMASGYLVVGSSRGQGPNIPCEMVLLKADPDNAGQVYVGGNDVSDDGEGARSNGFAPTAEALIRRLRAALPAAKLIAWVFTWPGNYSALTQDQIDARDKWITLATTYGLALLRWDTYLEALVGEGYDDAAVEAYLSGVGDVHPNAAGHAAAFTLMAATITSLSASGQVSPLPERVYAESEDYEQTPIIRTGTDNDGETGTGWSTDGTARQSSTADDTICWVGTFCSFGWDTNYGAGAGVVAWKVDDGDYTNVDLSAQGVANRAVWNFERGAHTVTLKVVSGTVTINRFLAI